MRFMRGDELADAIETSFAKALAGTAKNVFLGLESRAPTGLTKGHFDAIIALTLS